MDGTQIDSPAPGNSAPHLSDILVVKALGEDRFRAEVHRGNHVGSIFGGGFIAQAIRCAEITAPGLVPHSAHACFHRPGEVALPVEYRLERTREGAASCAYRVAAWQGEVLVFEVLIGMARPRSGLEHQRDWAAPPPRPQAAPSPLEYAESQAGRLPPDQLAALRRIGANAGLEVRLIDPEAFLKPTLPAFARVWVRATPARAWDSDYAAMAFVSDFLIARAGTLPHMATWDPNGWTLSLDHGIWIHAAAPQGAWMLYEMESPWSGAGRAITFGRIYDEGGRILANVAQEVLIRTRS